MTPDIRKAAFDGAFGNRLGNSGGDGTAITTLEPL
jgi:hypothetical protein